jgi:hypothetical protein
VREASEHRRPSTVDTRATDELRYIRQTMAAASTFTAIPGPWTMGIGVTALGATVLAARMGTPEGWLAIWLIEAVLAILLGIAGIWLKARRTLSPLTAPPGRRFLAGYLAPLVSGAALTPVLALAGRFDLLPGVWLLLYGTAAVAGGVSSIKPVRWAGGAFMTLGLVALWVPEYADVLLAAGFGGIHIVFGWVVTRRYGD